MKVESQYTGTRDAIVRQLEYFACAADGSFDSLAESIFDGMESLEGSEGDKMKLKVTIEVVEA